MPVRDHDPSPWTSEPDPTSYRIHADWYLLDAHGHILADLRHAREETREFIVAAVNSHDSRTALLRDVINHLENPELADAVKAESRRLALVDRCRAAISET